MAGKRLILAASDPEFKMRYSSWLTLRPGEVIAAMFAAAVAAILLFGVLTYPEIGPRLWFNWGVGAAWNCARLGEVVCFKQQPTNADNKAGPSIKEAPAAP
jgi:hypothetical protein